MGRILTPDQIRMPIRKNEASKSQLFKAAAHFEQENNGLRQQVKMTVLLTTALLSRIGGSVVFSEQELIDSEQKFTGFRVNQQEGGITLDLTQREVPYVNEGSKQDSDTSNGESNKRDDEPSATVSDITTEPGCESTVA